MTTPPVVVLTDLFGNSYGSNHIDAVEGTIYPVVLDVSDPDHPTGATFDFQITGPDADLFYIADYQLIFTYEPDYENPIDFERGQSLRGQGRDQRRRRRPNQSGHFHQYH